MSRELDRRFRRAKRTQTMYAAVTALFLVSFLLVVIAGGSDVARLGLLVGGAFTIGGGLAARVELHGYLLAMLLADYEHRRETS